MTNSLKGLFIWTLVIASLVVGCSTPADRRGSPAKAPEPTEEDVRSYVAKGNYTAALGVLSDRYEKDRGSEEARDAFARVLQEVRVKADDAFVRGEYEKAGITYRLLLSHLPKDEALARSLSFSRSYLSGKLATCAKTLTDSGLERYGAGELEKAIRIWKSVLVFDPDNRDVKKAIETATTQLKTLKGTP